jgi:hypothetical protein
LSTYQINIHHQLIKLIITALSEWLTTPQPPRPEYLSQEFHSIFEHQSQIGWDQILNGRFATEWTSATQDIHKTDQWLTYTIRTIWHAFYNVWKTRCNKIHNEPESHNSQQLLTLKPQVEALYAAQSTIESQDAYIFATPIHTILTHPIPTLQKWILTATIRLRQIRQRKKEKLLNSKIHPLFLNTKFISSHKIKKVTTCQTKARTSNILPISSFFSIVPKQMKHRIQSPKDDLQPP